jgi:non-ribosomal peptide synthetase component F
LTLDTAEGGGAGSLEYDTDRWDAATAARLVERLVRWLSAAVEQPHRPLSTLPLLGEQELLQVLGAAAGAGLPSDAAPGAVHRLFERWAERTPQALAVAAGDGHLTYGELEAQANRLAGALAALGAGPEACVAVLLERGAEMIVAWLAVLKTGAAYLPLDPSHPRHRLELLLADSAAAVLVSWRGMPLPAGAAVNGPAVLLMDAEREPVAAGSPLAARRRSARRDVPAAALAYLIYTSGSTGRPKGVEVTHGSLANLVAWHCHRYRVTPQDRATQLASPSFDAAVWEVWPYLASGASLHVPDDAVRTSPGRLAAWLAAREITLAFLPTPLAEALLDEPLAAGLGLRSLLTGGDRLHRPPAAGLPFELVNHYGPTEATVVTTAGAVPAAPATPAVPAPPAIAATAASPAIPAPPPITAGGDAAHRRSAARSPEPGSTSSIAACTSWRRARAASWRSAARCWRAAIAGVRGPPRRRSFPIPGAPSREPACIAAAISSAGPPPATCSSSAASTTS